MPELATHQQSEKTHFTELKSAARTAKENLSEALTRAKRKLEKVHPLLPGIAVMAGTSVLGYALMQNPATQISTVGSGFLFNLGVLDFTTIAKAQPQLFVQQAGQLLSRAFLGYY